MDDTAGEVVGGARGQVQALDCVCADGAAIGVEDH